ncbi:MAG: sulfatase-like hydrolase/transferase [Planctomycetota bacterium]
MKRVAILIMLLSFGNLAAGFAVAQSTYPNVILIMTDDQGWGDVEFPQQLSPSPDDPEDAVYAGHPELKTPRLREMAEAGMQFNRFYSACPVCSPTRCSFLTGRHYRRTLVDHANVGRMLNRELTLTEVALSLGYNTGHFGKWHLGTLDKSVHPVDSNRGGTDRVNSPQIYSTPWNNGYLSTFATESKTQTFNPTDISPATHYWIDHEQSLSLNDPLLDGDDSKVIMDRVIPFIQNSVNENRPFLATVWFHTPHKPYDTIDNPTLFQFYTTEERSRMDLNERGYYSCLTAMDAQVGRLRDELETLGIDSDTLVVFTSDNGPENGVPYVASSATGGLRGNKRFLFEGGVRVPGLVVWPGEVAPGTTTDCVAGSIDLLPTLMDIWGVSMPDQRPVDGESILDVLRGNASTRTGTMKWDFQGLRSIVDSDGRYKAISTDSGANWALYDLIADPRETNDVSGSLPALTSQMTAEWNSWRSQVDIQRSTELDYEDYVSAFENIVVVESSPVSLEVGETTGPAPSLILEKQHATLQSALTVDAGGSPGTYDFDNPPAGASIAEGMTVDSFLLHFDPTSSASASASVTFDNAIVGVIAGEALLEASDDLAFSNPDFYDTAGSGDQLRGLDFHDSGSDDGFTISNDRRTLSVTLQSTAGTLDELRVVTASSKPAEVVPEAVLITKGHPAGGGQLELSSSDNQDLVVRRSIDSVQSLTEFEVKGFCPFNSPASMQVTLEGAVFARTNVVQSIELYNYDADTWELVDSRDATRLPSADSVVAVQITGDVTRFVEPGPGSMEARVRFNSPVQRQQFSSNTDRFTWTIGP